MPQSYIKQILDARVYDVTRETWTHEARLMSQRLDNRVWLKREDLQPVFSFKLRGAYCKTSRLTPEQRKHGVIAASAGNHAQGQDLLAIVSGANTNFNRRRYISERTEIGEQREAVLSVTVPERPGSFKQFRSAPGRRNIAECNYRFVDTRSAQVFVGLSVAPGGADLAALVADLRQRGYTTEDMSDNEVAKLHIWCTVGGHAPAQLQDERVYRVEFPERPGTLLKFLSGLGQHWNISMCHYRNHGAAYRRILIGIQAPDEERSEFEQVLDGIRYPYSEETGNCAYQLCLGGRKK